ncbi:Splicing factor 3B subunit 4, partial [Linum perenne]
RFIALFWFAGNLDERVSNRVLYDILIQAGRVVDLHIPRDRETDKPKGYAFAEYESEEVAEYAVKLFSGLVTLYNRTLRFKISGQDKPPQNLPYEFSTPNSSNRSRSNGGPVNGTEFARSSLRISSYSLNQVSPAVTTYPNGHGSHYNGYDNSRRMYGSSYDNVSRSRLRL